MNMLMIHWVHAHYFSYLYFMIVPALIICYQIFKIGSMQKKLVDKRYLVTMLINYVWWKKYCKGALFFIAIFFVGLVLLRPCFGKKEETVSQQGRDLVIAIDISRSMLAQDMQPNRLAFAAQKIKKLVYNLSCERIGLIVYSSKAFVQCPLTTDYRAFFMFLDQLNIDTVSQGATALDQAIVSACDLFASIPERKTKILVAFTDGEDFSQQLSFVKERAQEQGLSIFTIGIGTTQGAPIPILNDRQEQVGWEKDEQGALIMSCLNEPLLKEVAQKSGGIYLRAQDSDKDIQLLLEQIDRFEKSLFEDKTIFAWQDQYPYWALIALICLALEWIL